MDCGTSFQEPEVDCGISVEEVVIDSAEYVGGRRSERGSASLELVLVVPVLMLLVIFVLWAGRGGRAGLVTDLAAGEAATVAALYSDDPTDAAERERVVEQVLSARPGLDYLCIGGARGRDYETGDDGFVDEQWVTFEPELAGHSPGVGVIGVSLECVTDGAVGPTRHLFPTVSFSGHATEVVAVDPRPLLSVVQASGNEGDTGDMNVVEFLFQLSTASSGQDVIIEYFTRPHTAGAAPATIVTDYTEVPSSPVSSVPIRAGELSATVSIPITGEDLYEFDETFELVWRLVPSMPCPPGTGVPDLDPSVNRLSPHSYTPTFHPVGHANECEPTNPDYWRAVSVGTILNDDLAPQLSVTSPTAAEDAGQMTFRVGLDAPTAVTTRFDYTTVDGTAILGADYTPRVLPGATIGADVIALPFIDVHVQIIDDFVAEPDETFVLNITNVDAHARATDPLEGTATITDEEPTIRIVGNPAREVEGSDLAFDVTAANVVAGQLATVTYTVTDGTANSTTPNLDYSVASRLATDTLTFNTNATQTITVNTVDDTIDEASETFTVTLSSPSTNARILGAATVTGVIVDNDLTPVLRTAPTVTVAEGDTVDLNFNLSNTSSADVEFGFSDRPTADTTDVDAGPADYSVKTTSPLTITAGITGPETVEIEALSDSYLEADETFELHVDYANNAGRVPETVTVTITDVPPADFTVNDPEADEGEPLDFTISLDPAIPTGSIGVTVHYTVSIPSTGTDSAESEDYDSNHISGSVIFDPGDTSKTVAVDTVFDLDYPEGTEKLLLTIDTELLPDGFASSKPTGEGLIRDVLPPVLSVNDANADEGSNLEFILGLDPAPVLDVTFDVCTYALRATPGTDYQDGIESPNCSPRTMTGNVHTETISTFSDSILDDNENLLLRVRNLENAILSDTDAVGVGTINDVLSLVVNVSDASAVEGDKAGFVVTLNIAAPEQIQVGYETDNYGTAQPGPDGIGDYEHTSGALIFEKDDDEKIITVQTWTDAIDEPNENFFLEISLADPGQGTVQDSEGEGLITQGQTPTFSIDNATAAEGQPLTVNVHRSGDLSKESTVQYRTADLATVPRPATGGVLGCTTCDYYTTDGRLTFGKGEDLKSFMVQTVADSTAVGESPYEEFKAELFTPTNGVLTRATGLLTINEACIDPADPDAFPPTITGIDSTVNEGNSAIEFEFEINPALCSTRYPSYDNDDDAGTATLNEDYSFTGTGFARYFGVSEIVLRPLKALEDDIDEPDETVVYVIQSWPSWRGLPLNQMFLDQPTGLGGELARATVTIVDNDDPPSVSIFNTNAVENSTARFKLRLSAPSGREIIVPYYTDNLSTALQLEQAQAGLDYVQISSSVVIPAGAIEAEATVEVLPDSDPELEERFQVWIVGPDPDDPDPAYTLGDSNAEGTIFDGEHRTLSIESIGSASEDDSATFTVTLDEASTQQVTVDYATVELSGDGAASEGDDYTAISDSLTFMPGETTISFNVAILPDSEVEDEERFQVELSNPTNAVLIDSIALGTIAGQCVNPGNPDHAPPTVTIPNITINEDAGNESINFTVIYEPLFCSGSYWARAQMNVVVSHITTNDSDIGIWSPPSVHTIYFLSESPVHFPQLALKDDSIVEDDETFEIAATWVRYFDESLDRQESMPQRFLDELAVVATGTIIDDDELTLVSVDDASGREGTTLRFPVRLSEPAGSGMGMSVDYVVSAKSTGTNRATLVVDFGDVSGTVTIGSGQVGGVIEVPLVNDDVVEGDEEFLVTLSRPNPSDGVQIDVGTAVGTILDVAEPTVSVSNVVADEGQVMNFEVTLDHAGIDPVAVEYATAAQTATEGFDYLRASGVARFAPGETSKTVTVAALADNLPLEGNETFFLRLSNPLGASLRVGSGLGTIRDLGVPEISVSDTQAVEGASVLFEVALTNRANRDVTVNYSTEPRNTSGDVAATVSDDYTAVSGTVTISAGNTAVTVGVPSNDDFLDEHQEVFGLVLSTPDYGTLKDSRATGTIIDNDPVPQLLVDDVFTAEDATTMAVVVRLNAISGRSVAVDYTLSDGTATAGDDYRDSSGTLTIPAGRLTTTVDVALIDDDSDEGAEAFTIELTNPLNASISGVGTAQLTILDNEGLPTLYLDPQGDGVVEGNEAQITLRLSHAASSGVSVDYQTSDGDATAGDDYVARSLTTETIDAGDLEKTLSTATIDDSVTEDAEYFNWVFSNATNAQLASTNGSSWILDNDAVPTLSVGDTSVNEGDRASFTVRLSSPADSDVTVSYETQADPFAGGAAAVPAQDFAVLSGTVTIAQGQRTATVAVLVPDDALNEGTETFWLRLDAQSATGADVNDAVGVGSILDDDPLPNLSIHNATAIEGEPVQFGVRLDNPSGRVVRAEYVATVLSTADPQNQATPVRDFDATPKSVLIPAGVTEVTAELDTVIDRISEYEEQFLLRLFNATHASITDSRAEGTIIDSNDLPRATIADTQAVEGAGSAEFTVTLSHASTAPITFLYSTTDDTATDTGDYVAISDSTLTVAANNTSATFTVMLRDDTISESDETFSVSLRNPSGATLIDDESVATIIDDDGLPRFVITDSQADETDDSIEFTVTLSHQSAQTTSVDYVTFDNTATQPDDYTTTSQTLTFNPGITTQTITVPINDDLLDEFDETVTLRLSNPVGAIVRPTEAVATGTIEDDDPEPTLTVLNSVADEGEPLNFTAYLDAPSGRTVSATYNTTSDGDGPYPATPTDDYIASSGLLSFSPGDTTKTIAVTTRFDALTEAPETLLLTLSNPRYTTLSTNPTATGTIRNQQPPAITINDSSALEGDPMVFTVNLDRPSDTDVTVTYADIPNLADPQFDYTVNAPTQVTIPVGQTQANLTVFTVADHHAEFNETFLIQLTGVTGNARIQDGVAIGTILNDAVAPSLTVNDVQTPEGTAATFTVTLTRSALTTDAPVSIGYNTNGLTASNIDYSARTGRLQFPQSTTTQQLTVSVPTTPDELSETNETFQLVLHSPQGDLTIEDSTGTATILDDDAEPTLSINNAETDEGTPLVFTATLDSPSGRRITADYRTNSLTATNGVDYASAVGSLVFPVGATTQDVTVTTLPDRLIEVDETFEMALSNPVGTVLGNNGTGTIIDATRPGIRVADAATEEGGTLEFTVTLNRQSSDTITVDYATNSAGIAGTATSGTDYTERSGTLTFLPGVTQLTVRVATRPDSLNEPDETLTLTLSNQDASAKILDGTATGTIHNAALVTISINDATGAEDRFHRPVEMNFDVRLSRPADNTVTVEWRTVDGTATGADIRPPSLDPAWYQTDYLSASGTIIFDAGETLQTIPVTIYGDFTYELDQTFFVELHHASNAILNPDPHRATGTIYNSDHKPVINVLRSTIIGGHNEERGGTTLSFHLFRRSDFEVSLDIVATSLPPGGSLPAATAGSDFEAVSDTITIEPGNTSANITIPYINDNLYEGTEYFALYPSNPVNAYLSTSQLEIEVPIYDDESFINDISTPQGAEGGLFSFRLRRGGRNLSAATINYATADGSAIGGDFVGCTNCDYVESMGTIDFREGRTSAWVFVRTINDSLAEGPESFELRLTTAVDSAIGLPINSSTATILDTTERIVSLRRQPSHDMFDIGDIGNPEGNTLLFAVSMDHSTTHSVTGNYELIPGTATSNDYIDRGSGSWAIGAGSNRGSFLIQLRADGIDEPDEMFQVRISDPQGAVLGHDTADVTIQDNDPQPRLEISDSTQQEGDPAEFTVVLKSPDRLTYDWFHSGFVVTVDYTTQDVSATAGVHYTATSGTLTFAPGETEKTITVATSDDSIVSGNRVFQVQLDNPMNVRLDISRTMGLGRIVENDCVKLSDPNPPSLAMASAGAAEGDNMSFTVTLDKPFCDDVAQAVTFSTSLNTASSADVTTPSAVLGFKAGQTQVTYSGVTTIEDTLDEPDETITATATWHSTMPTSYQATVTATGTINDNDDEPNLRIIDATSNYEGGSLAFIVSLDSPSGKQINVDYATNTAGTATTGTDYTAESGTLTFDPGQTTKQIVVQSISDILNETDETFQVKLSNPTNALLGDTIGIGTIENDDPLPVLSISDASAEEDDIDGVPFTITLDTASGRDVIVVYTTADGTATVADNDYTAVTSTAMIIAGQTTTTIEIKTTADTADEGDETFTVQLVAQHLGDPDDVNDNVYTDNAIISTTNHTATGTITNDDT